MIGVAVLTSKEKTFLSIASQKIKGGKETIGLLKNSSKISSICNDFSRINRLDIVNNFSLK